MKGVVLCGTTRRMSLTTPNYCGAVSHRSTKKGQSRTSHIWMAAEVQAAAEPAVASKRVEGTTETNTSRNQTKTNTNTKSKNKNKNKKDDRRGKGKARVCEPAPPPDPGAFPA